MSGVPFLLLGLVLNVGGEAGPLKAAKSLRLLRILKLIRLMKIESMLGSVDPTIIDIIHDFLADPTVRL